MKRNVLFFIVALFVYSCSQSPEDKVNTLIKAEMNKLLNRMDTYEPVETVVDSAFSPKDDPVFIKKLEDVGRIGMEIELLENEMSTAYEMMSIYKDSYSSFSKNEYQKYKDQYDEAIEKVNMLTNKGKGEGKKLAEELDNEPIFIGYKAFHKYRAQNNAGQTLLDDHVFLIDPNMEKIVTSWDRQYYDDAQEAIKQALENIK